MPSYRARSRSRSASPQSRSHRRRDGADDAGPSRRDSHRQKDERSDRRRRDDHSDEEDSKRRRRRYDDDDDRGEKRGDSRRRSRSQSRDRATSRDYDKRRHNDEPRDYDRDRNGSEQRNAGRSTQALPSQNSAMVAAGVPPSKKFGKQGAQSRSPSPSAEAIAASKPNFSNSGALAAETNTFKGVVLKYNEPPEARKPAKGWRLYVFKGKEQVDMVQVNRQSAYLFGRDKVVVDIPIEHPSASKQHAVLQYRQVHERNEFGDAKSVTKPYIIDLDSANGTTVNEQKVPPSRYYELHPNDLIKFAYSTREYVLLAE